MPSSGPSLRSGIGPDDATLHPGQIGEASPLLFTGLIDDAAVFPPGNAPLEQALRDHLVHRQARYADAVGPLLVRSSDLAELAELVAAQHLPAPLSVGVVVPGDAEQAREALVVAGQCDSLDLVAVELSLGAASDAGQSLTDTWSALGGGRRAVWFKLDRTTPVRDQLDLLARASAKDAGGAKLRTGGVTAEAFASEAEVAAFLRHAIDVDLTFKLTAGLHHAVRCTDPASGLEQHGVLNILCAIKAALNGAEEDELESVLAERDPQPLVVQGHGMSEADASVIRAFWASFGCCGVTDPINELVALGLMSSGTPDR